MFCIVMVVTGPNLRIAEDAGHQATLVRPSPLIEFGCPRGADLDVLPRPIAVRRGCDRVACRPVKHRLTRIGSPLGIDDKAVKVSPEPFAVTDVVVLKDRNSAILGAHTAIIHGYPCAAASSGLEVSARDGLA
jgi:hypothetical protein